MTPLETLQGVLGAGQFLLEVSSPGSGLVGLDIVQAQEPSPVSATTIGMLRYLGSSSPRRHCTKVNVSVRQLINKGGTRHPTMAQRIAGFQDHDSHHSPPRDADKAGGNLRCRGL